VPDPSTAGRFQVHLPVFEGPFDLLLALIAKHQLDITTVALAQVTDEFLAYLRSLGGGWDLGRTTEFLVVAATLLDLKVARLLPRETPPDEEDLALLEARDLLFARLLQYRAYRQAAGLFADLMARAGRRHGRAAGLDPRFVPALPDVVLGADADALAAVAARATAPRPTPQVPVAHVHAARVNVAEQMVLVLRRLDAAAATSFQALTADCTTLLELVGRFLAVLELYREGSVLFEQAEALAELLILRAPAAGAPAGPTARSLEAADER